MSIYSDKLAHVQVIINCRASVLGVPYLDGVVSYIACAQHLYRGKRMVTLVAVVSQWAVAFVNGIFVMERQGE